jgi:glutaconate CoA-transferase subunit B
MLLTTKGIFRFDEKTKEIYLSKVHPGVSVDSIKKNVPWDLKVAHDLSETDRPSDAEIDFVRRFAPTEVVGRKLMYELGLGNAFKKAQARGKM